MYTITITGFNHNIGYSVSKVFYAESLKEVKDILTEKGFQECSNNWIKDGITAEVEPVVHLSAYNC